MLARPRCLQEVASEPIREALQQALPREPARVGAPQTDASAALHPESLFRGVHAMERGAAGASGRPRCGGRGTEDLRLRPHRGANLQWIMVSVSLRLCTLLLGKKSK